MKKYHIKKDIGDIFKIIVNKQLEKHNVDFDYIRSLPEGRINDMDWFKYYTMTQLEHKEWKLFCIDFIKNQCTPRQTNKYAEKLFGEIDFFCGLMVV